MKIKQYPGSIVITSEVKTPVNIKDEEGNTAFVFSFNEDKAELKSFAFVGNAMIDGKIAITVAADDTFDLDDFIMRNKRALVAAKKYEVDAKRIATELEVAEAEADAIIADMLA